MDSLVAYLFHKWAEPKGSTEQCKDSKGATRKTERKITTSWQALLAQCFIQTKKDCNPRDCCVVFHSAGSREVFCLVAGDKWDTLWDAELPLCFGGFGLGMGCAPLLGRTGINNTQLLHFSPFNLSQLRCQDGLEHVSFCSFQQTQRTNHASSFLDLNGDGFCEAVTASASSPCLGECWLSLLSLTQELCCFLMQCCNLSHFPMCDCVIAMGDCVGMFVHHSLPCIGQNARLEDGRFLTLFSLFFSLHKKNHNPSPLHSMNIQPIISKASPCQFFGFLYFFSAHKQKQTPQGLILGSCFEVSVCLTQKGSVFWCVPVTKSEWSILIRIICNPFSV